jgi:hypothetical protein
MNPEDQSYTHRPASSSATSRTGPGDSDSVDSFNTSKNTSGNSEEISLQSTSDTAGNIIPPTETSLDQEMGQDRWLGILAHWDKVTPVIRQKLHDAGLTTYCNELFGRSHDLLHYHFRQGKWLQYHHQWVGLVTEALDKLPVAGAQKPEIDAVWEAIYSKSVPVLRSRTQEALLIVAFDNRLRLFCCQRRVARAWYDTPQERLGQCDVQFKRLCRGRLGVSYLGKDWD